MVRTLHSNKLMTPQPLDATKSAQAWMKCRDAIVSILQRKSKETKYACPSQNSHVFCRSDYRCRC